MLVLLVGGLLVSGPILLGPGDPPPPPSHDGLAPSEHRYVSAWLPYWKVDEGLASFEANADRFTDLTTFFHYVSGPDAALADHAKPSAARRVIAAAHERGVLALAAVLDDTPAGTMSSVLADPALRSAHIQALLSLVDELGYDGIDIDYEQFAFADGRDTWEQTRPSWVAFITELSAELHQRDKILTVAVPPQTGPTSGFWVYDWPSIAPSVDQLRVMTYDYSTNEPGPIAPMPWVQQAAEYGLTVLGPEKLRIGVPMYGRNWATASSGEGCASADYTRRNSLTAAEALDLAAREGVEVSYDETNQEASFSYTQELDGCAVSRVVHFADARSVAARATYAQSRGTGIALWSLGGEDPATWSSLPG